MCFWGWLENRENEISHFNDFISIIASFFSVFGTIIAIILLIITINQISIASRNLKASTVYSIAKDGRELNKQIKEMAATTKKINYGYVFNYLHSVWHQKRLGILDERMWAPVENETCFFLKENPKANSYWNGKTRSFFDPDFVEYVEYIEKVGKEAGCGERKGGSQ